MRVLCWHSIPSLNRLAPAQKNPQMVDKGKTKSFNVVGCDGAHAPREKGRRCHGRCWKTRFSVSSNTSVMACANIATIKKN
jgi:hypothetical protein